MYHLAEWFPHPSAHCCLNCCPDYFVYLDCQLKLPFSYQSLTWSEDQRLIPNTRTLSKLAKVLEYFLVIVWEPKPDITWSPFRRESRGYQRVQRDRVRKQPSGQRNATIKSSRDISLNDQRNQRTRWRIQVRIKQKVEVLSLIESKCRAVQKRTLQMHWTGMSVSKPILAPKDLFWDDLHSN